MKQLRVILKAQEAYFDLSTPIVHKYEGDMTNIGQQHGPHKAGCPRHQCHLAGRCSSCYLHTCGWLRCGVQSRAPGLSESPLVASFGSDGHLNDTKL